MVETTQGLAYRKEVVNRHSGELESHCVSQRLF